MLGVEGGTPIPSTRIFHVGLLLCGYKYVIDVGVHLLQIQICSKLITLQTLGLCFVCQYEPNEKKVFAFLGLYAA
jgi:hypothetical protein